MKVLALDVGGSYIKSALADEKANFSKKSKVPTPRDSFDSFLKTIKAIIAEKGEPNLAGLAFSLPGTIDTKSGYIYQGGNLRYHDRLFFCKEVSAAIGLPVTIENDARCAALAEIWQGALGNVQNALVLVVGTGLGGAIIQNGKLYKGSHLLAGELSLIITKDIKKHGWDGILGPQVGIPSFVERCKELTGEQLDGPALFQKIKRGHSLLKAEFDRYLENFVVQIFNFQISYDPEVILIGGGISENPIYMDALKAKMEAFYEQLPIAIPHQPLRPCTFHNDSNLIGAVYQFINAPVPK